MSKPKKQAAPKKYRVEFHVRIDARATRVAELEAELELFKTGRRYCGGPQMDMGSPIECLRRQTEEIAKACNVTEDEWYRGWTVTGMIEQVRKGLR
jgi:hypothetical protein